MSILFKIPQQQQRKRITIQNNSAEHRTEHLLFRFQNSQRPEPREPALSTER